MTIRVVRIIDRLNIGGPAKHVTWLSAGLNSQEFKTVLITGTVPPKEGDMSYFAHAAGLEPVIISEMSRELSPRDLVVVYKLAVELFRWKPHIVHTHKAKAGATGRVAALLYKWLTPSALWLRPRKCKIVHTYHGHIFHSYYGRFKTRLFLAVERLLAIICTDRVITISEEQRREICGTFKVGRLEQFAVIPLGIDFGEIGSRRSRLRDELKLDDKIPLIGIAGRLCEVKNHEMLLEVAANLRALEVGAHFVIIGDGHLRETLEKKVRELGISEMVSFTGFREDALSLYADLDIVALTSLNEGTPLTLIEAMCCKVPVMATEVGGVVDLMGARHERNGSYTIWDHGVTAPSRDVPSFASGLKFLIEREDLRREMGERGRLFVRSRLSKDRLISDIKDLYRELLNINTNKNRELKLNENPDHRRSRFHRVTSGRAASHKRR
jgi:glycosyltransferase involved in cell wall biosynthesis